MSIFTCSGEIPFFAMQQEEFISGCPSSPVIYRVETHITGQMNLRLDQIDLRPLNAVISCFRMCVVKNIDNSDVIVPLSVKAEAQIQAMKEAIDSTVMIHIDEPGFLNALQALATKFNDHMSFCLDEYYTALRFSLSSADKAHVNAQFEQMVLS